MIQVLFICEHNSARSQIAEAYLNHLGRDTFYAESAGLKPGALNPYAVAVIGEEGLDISGNITKSVFDLYKSDKDYDVIVTVCSRADNSQCPIFPGRVKRLHWPFDDPSKLAGTPEEILIRTRAIRDEIKSRILSFIEEYGKKKLKLFIE